MRTMNSYPTLRRWLSLTLTLLVLAALLIVAGGREPSPTSPSPARADDVNSSMARAWPLFGGSLSRNMVNLLEKNISAEWSIEEGKQKNIKWIAPLGTRSYGGPVVAGGKIFVGTNRAVPQNPKVPGDKGVVKCFREADGQFLWQAIHDKLPAGLVNDWPDQGICSTPVIEGNRLYYVSNRCELICATTDGLGAGKNEGVQNEQYKGPTDADIVWRLDMIQELNVFPHNLATSSPLILGDLVFIVTSNGVDEGHINIPSPKAPSFIAVDKKTGKVKWQDNSPGEKILHGQWSNPVYAVVKGRPEVIFPGGDGWLRAFEPQTGKLIWKFDVNPKSSVYKLRGRGTRNEIISTPVVFDDKVYVGVGQDPEHGYGVGHFWCIDLTKAGDKFGVDLSPVNDNFDPKAEVNKNSGLVWHFGGVADAKTAEEIGRDFIFGRTISTCAIHDGLVYIAELEGYLHCLDAKTGKQYWVHNTQAETWGSPYYVDGKVYLGNDDGNIYVFKHGKEKDLIDTIEMKARVRSTPVAVNGVLYVMTENHLFAIAKK
jgi:outer membrane protein assembly factor BamB